MLQIGNIDAFADLAPASSSSAKSRTSEKRAVKSDSVEVSTEAQQAAEVFKMAASNATSEIRQEVVEAARKRIEEGTYRMQSVVTLVASRLTRYV